MLKLAASVIRRLSSQLNKKLEDYIIEGLKRKGFEVLLLTYNT